MPEAFRSRTISDAAQRAAQRKSASRVAWAQVNSTPKGAEIIVDGTSTGQFTPARVQVLPVAHGDAEVEWIQLAKRTVQVSEGGAVTINESLHEK